MCLNLLLTPSNRLEAPNLGWPHLWLRTLFHGAQIRPGARVVGGATPPPPYTSFGPTLPPPVRLGSSNPSLVCQTHQNCATPPCVTFHRVAGSQRGLDSHLFFPSHAVSGRCVLMAAAACVVSFPLALAEPSNWHTGVVLVVAGVVLQSLLPTPLHVPCVSSSLASLAQ